MAITGDTVWEADWHDRQAVALGILDYRSQVGIKNRFYKEEAGIHLLTPMRLEGSDVVLMVDRGWIPQAWVSGDWSQYDEGEGLVEVRGLLQDANPYPPGTEVDPMSGRLLYREDLELLGRVLELDVAPMFLLLQPAEGEPQGWPAASVEGPAPKRRQPPELCHPMVSVLAHSWRWLCTHGPKALPAAC